MLKFAVIAAVVACSLATGANALPHCNTGSFRLNMNSQRQLEIYVRCSCLPDEKMYYHSHEVYYGSARVRCINKKKKCRWCRDLTRWFKWNYDSEENDDDVGTFLPPRQRPSISLPPMCGPRGTYSLSGRPCGLRDEDDDLGENRRHLLTLAPPSPSIPKCSTRLGVNCIEWGKRNYDEDEQIGSQLPDKLINDIMSGRLWDRESRKKNYDEDDQIGTLLPDKTIDSERLRWQKMRRCKFFDRIFRRNICNLSEIDLGSV